MRASYLSHDIGIKILSKINPGCPLFLSDIRMTKESEMGCTLILLR
jgi:hypothetical protein